MALTGDINTLNNAFSGLGVDEKSLISILGNWHPDESKSFRKGTPHFFKEDERLFERWNDDRVKLLKHEFMRFHNAVVLWAMHPWERDAHLVKEALKKGPEMYGVIVEIACTRSSEELLGARKAYHSLFEHSIEEDVAYHIDGPWLQGHKFGVICWYYLAGLVFSASLFSIVGHSWLLVFFA